MTTFFTKAAFAALIGLGSLAAVPATASANDVGIYFGIGGPNVHYGRHGPRFEGGNRWNRGGYCTNRHAVIKAARSGLHRAHVVRRNAKRVVVEGRRHHRHDRVVFANNRSCSPIRW